MTLPIKDQFPRERGTLLSGQAGQKEKKNTNFMGDCACQKTCQFACHRFIPRAVVIREGKTTAIMRGII